jgi:hypothetical protein
MNAHPILSSTLGLVWIIVILAGAATAWIAVRRYLLR